jgi:hypothetical protein
MQKDIVNSFHPSFLPSSHRYEAPTVVITYFIVLPCSILLHCVDLAFSNTFCLCAAMLLHLLFIPNIYIYIYIYIYISTECVHVYTCRQRKYTKSIWTCCHYIHLLSHSFLVSSNLFKIGRTFISISQWWWSGVGREAKIMKTWSFCVIFVLYNSFIELSGNSWMTLTTSFISFQQWHQIRATESAGTELV